MSIISTIPTFTKISVNTLFMGMITLNTCWRFKVYGKRNVHNVKDTKIVANSQCKPLYNVSIEDGNSF
jgi:hypothetical protein